MQQQVYRSIEASNSNIHIENNVNLTTTTSTSFDQQQSSCNYCNVSIITQQDVHNHNPENCRRKLYVLSHNCCRDCNQHFTQYDSFAKHIDSTRHIIGTQQQKSKRVPSIEISPTNNRQSQSSNNNNNNGFYGHSCGLSSTPPRQQNKPSTPPPPYTNGFTCMSPNSTSHVSSHPTPNYQNNPSPPVTPRGYANSNQQQSHSPRSVNSRSVASSPEPQQFRSFPQFESQRGMTSYQQQQQHLQSASNSHLAPLNSNQMLLQQQQQYQQKQQQLLQQQQFYQQQQLQYQQQQQQYQQQQQHQREQQQQHQQQREQSASSKSQAAPSTIEKTAILYFGGVLRPGSQVGGCAWWVVGPDESILTQGATAVEQLFPSLVSLEHQALFHGLQAAKQLELNSLVIKSNSSMVLSHFANERNSPYFRASSNAVSDFIGRISMALGHLHSYDLVCIPASANYYVRTLADESIANFDRRKDMQAQMQAQVTQQSFDSALHRPVPMKSNFYSLAYATTEPSVSSALGSINSSDFDGMSSFHNTSFGSTTHGSNTHSSNSDKNYSPTSLSKVPSYDESVSASSLSYFHSTLKECKTPTNTNTSTFCEPPPGLGFAQPSLFESVSGFSSRHSHTPISDFEQLLGVGNSNSSSNYHLSSLTTMNGSDGTDVFSSFHSSSPSSMF